MASLPCGPGCEDGGDLGVLRTDGPQGVSSLGLGLPVTWLSHQCPHRKGNSLFLKARRCSCDSPSVFLRHPFQVWSSRACPSLCKPPLGVCFLLCPPISRSPGVLSVDRVCRRWRCFGEDAVSCCPQGSDTQRHTFFFNCWIITLQYGAGSAIHQHGSAVCVTCPPSRTSLPSGLYRALCELAESQGTFPRGLFYTCWCARFHATLSIRPTLSFPSVSINLLFMRDK